ncbi:MAG: retropepsin-like aspartic protease [Maricaulaceae bacterium]|jgi:predicted aspartyl protease
MHSPAARRLPTPRPARRRPGRRAPAIAIALLALCGCATEAAGPRPDALAVIRADDGRVFVPVMLNGRGPYAFLLDSGAGATVLDDDLIEEAGLAPIGEAVTIVGLSSSAELTTYVPAQIEFGGRDIELARILVHDLGPRGAQGVLGLDVLSRFAVEIDGPNEIVRLWSDGYVEPNPRRIRARLEMRANAYDFPFVAHQLNDQDGVAFIDTGYRGFIVDPELAAQADLETGSFRAVLTDFAYGTTTFSELGSGDLALGDFIYEDARMALLRPAVFDVFAEYGVTTMLGARLFAEMTLVLDFPGQRVLLVDSSRALRRGVGPYTR